MRRVFAFLPSSPRSPPAVGDARRRRQRRRPAHPRAGPGRRLGLHPLVLIGGHYHCSPPGKPGVQEIIDGTATSPSIVHQVFRPDGTFAGTETLIRADLFAGQACPTDQWLPVPPWLPTPAYYACHHFAFTP